MRSAPSTARSASMLAGAVRSTTARSFRVIRALYGLPGDMNPIDEWGLPQSHSSAALGAGCFRFDDDRDVRDRFCPHPNRNLVAAEMADWLREFDVALVDRVSKLFGKLFGDVRGCNRAKESVLIAHLCLE